MSRLVELRKELEVFVEEKGTVTRLEMKDFLEEKDSAITDLDKDRIIERATNSNKSPIIRVGRGLYSTLKIEGLIPKIHHKIQLGIVSVHKEINSKTIDILNTSEKEFAHIKELVDKMKELEDCINGYNSNKSNN